MFKTSHFQDPPVFNLKIVKFEFKILKQAVDK